MSFPVLITYRGLEPSEALNELIREEAAKLSKFFDGIVSCRVLVERQAGHHHISPLHVRVNLVVPGADLAIVTEPGTRTQPPGDEAARPPAWTIRDTFRRARRRVRDYAARLR